MSELSEEAYFAGWMAGLEYALWEVLVEGRGKYGWLVVTEEQRARLRQLSNDCGGWIVFDDATEETWLAINEWEARFGKWKSTSSGGGG